MKPKTLRLIEGTIVLVGGLGVLWLAARFAKHTPWPTIIEFLGYAIGVAILYVGVTFAFQRADGPGD